MMDAEFWLFVTVVWLTCYYEYRTWRRTEKNIEAIVQATLSNKAKNLILVSTPSLHKNEVTHIFKFSEPPEASTN